MTILGKKQMSEEDIKLNYITPVILDGWKGHVTMETKITDGRINISGNIVARSKPKFADYKMNITAIPSHDLDEWEAAGLTKADSIQVPAKRVAESPIQFECEYVQTIHFPSKSKKGVIDMVIAKVVEVHIDDDVLTPDGKIDFLKIKPLGRMGYWDYTYVNDVFSMAIPGLTAAQMSGMGGDRLKKD